MTNLSSITAEASITHAQDASPLALHRTFFLTRSQLPVRGLLPRHRRSTKKRLRSAETRTLLVSRTRTNFGDRASLELSANGPQTAGIVIQQFQTIAEDILCGYRDQSAV